MYNKDSTLLLNYLKLKHGILVNIKNDYGSGKITKFEYLAFQGILLGTISTAELLFDTKLPFKKIDSNDEVVILKSFCFLSAIEIQLLFERMKKKESLQALVDVPKDRFIKDYSELIAANLDDYVTAIINAFNNMLTKGNDIRDLFYTQVFEYMDIINKNTINLSDIEKDIGNKIMVSATITQAHIATAQAFDEFMKQL